MHPTGRCTNAHGLHLPEPCKAEPRESTKGCAATAVVRAWPMEPNLSSAWSLLLAHADLLDLRSVRLSLTASNVWAGLHS